MACIVLSRLQAASCGAKSSVLLARRNYSRSATIHELASSRRGRFTERLWRNSIRGSTPSVEKQVRKKAQAEAEAAEALTFEKVAREWFENRKYEWTPKYAEQVIGRLEADLFPHIGALGIAKIEPPVMLAALKKAEARGVLETTRRLKQYASSIFRFAIASGYRLYDPAAPLSGALKAPTQPNHHKAIPRSEVGGLMRKIAAYDGEPETRIAIHLALLTVVRTNELRRARWDEFEYLDDVEKSAMARAGRADEDARSASCPLVRAGDRRSARTETDDAPYWPALSRQGPRWRYVEQHNVVRALSLGLSRADDNAWLPSVVFDGGQPTRLQ